MIWLVLALYLLGALAVQSWFYEIGETHLLAWRWFMIGAAWWLVTLIVIADQLMTVVGDTQRKESPNA